MPWVAVPYRLARAHLDLFILYYPLFDKKRLVTWTRALSSLAMRRLRLIDESVTQTDRSREKQLQQTVAMRELVRRLPSRTGGDSLPSLL